MFIPIEQQLSKAIRIASTEFEGVMDKGGQPYILHCLAVMEGVRSRGPCLMTAAVLHDLLEDREDWTAERLISEGFDAFVVVHIVILTHAKDESYEDYIERCSRTEETTWIKLADLRHNMDPSRLPDLSEKSMARMQKYHRAYQYLLNKEREGRW